MSFKLKALVAALAIASISGVANAAIGNSGQNGNAELYLTVWDQAGQRSYTRDLGITIDSFGTANAPVSAGFTGVVDLPTSSELNIAGDANWATFIEGQTNVASYQWNIFAGDSNGTAGPGQRRMVYTSKNDDVASAALPGVWLPNNSATGLEKTIINMDAFVNALNGVDANLAVNNSYIVTDPSLVSYGGYQAGVFGAAPNLNFYASVGESQNFFYATRSGSSNAAEALFTKYGNAGGASAWTLAANGSLNFTPPVAPVPEPGEWAMLLAGLAVVGSMARRRMSSHV